MADVEKIPTDPTLGDWEQDTALDGQTFTLRFLYNSRSDRYFMTVTDQDGNVVTSHQRIVAQVPFMTRIKDPRMPPGQISLSFPSGNGQDPRFSELGAAAQLVYSDEEMVDILKSLAR